MSNRQDANVAPAGSCQPATCRERHNRRRLPSGEEEDLRASLRRPVGGQLAGDDNDATTLAAVDADGGVRTLTVWRVNGWRARPKDVYLEFLTGPAIRAPISACSAGDDGEAVLARARYALKQSRT